MTSRVINKMNQIEKINQERIMNWNEDYEDIIFSIPFKYLNIYVSALNGKKSNDEDLETSNGFSNICRLAYRKCQGPLNKEIFKNYCVSNKGSSVEKILLSMDNFIQNTIKEK